MIISEPRWQRDRVQQCTTDILKWSQKDYSGKTWVSGPVDSKPLCHSGQMSRVPKVLGSQSVSQQYQMYLKNKDLHCIVQMNIFPLSKIRMICMCVDLIGNFLFHGRTLPIYLPPPPKHINCFLFLYMPVLVIPRVSVLTVKHGEIKFFLASWKLNTHIGCFTCDTLQKLKIPNPARNC